MERHRESLVGAERRGPAAEATPADRFVWKAINLVWASKALSWPALEAIGRAAQWAIAGYFRQSPQEPLATFLQDEMGAFLLGQEENSQAVKKRIEQALENNPANAQRLRQEAAARGANLPAELHQAARRELGRELCAHLRRQSACAIIPVCTLSGEPIVLRLSQAPGLRAYKLHADAMLTELVLAMAAAPEDIRSGRQHPWAAAVLHPESLPVSPAEGLLPADDPAARAALWDLFGSLCHAAGQTERKYLAPEERGREMEIRLEVTCNLDGLERALLSASSQRLAPLVEILHFDGRFAISAIGTGKSIVREVDGVGHSGLSARIGPAQVIWGETSSARLTGALDTVTQTLLPTFGELAAGTPRTELRLELPQPLSIAAALAAVQSARQALEKSGRQSLAADLTRRCSTARSLEELVGAMAETLRLVQAAPAASSLHVNNLSKAPRGGNHEQPR